MFDITTYDYRKANRTIIYLFNMDYILDFNV